MEFDVVRKLFSDEGLVIGSINYQSQSFNVYDDDDCVYRWNN